MITAQQIEGLVEEHIAGTDKFIVEVKVKTGNKILVALDSPGKIVIADCVQLSRFIEGSLDREVEDFSLEVGSPGMTEPFKVLKQYYKHVGRLVTVVTREGGEKIEGKLSAADEQGITLSTERIERVGKGSKGKQIITETISLTYSQIKETKLVLSF